MSQLHDVQTYCDDFHEFRMSPLIHKFKAFYVGGYHKRFVVFGLKIRKYCSIL